MSKAKRVPIATAMTLAFVLAGCTSPNIVVHDSPGRGDIIADEPTADTGSTEPMHPDLSAPTFDFVSMSDPVMDAFWVSVPAGWDSIAYSTGTLDITRQVVSSVSPDGGTVLFLGDPKIPQYHDPSFLDPALAGRVELIETIELSSYIPAEQYFEQYAQRKFGGLDGFMVNGVTSDPELYEYVLNEFASQGTNPLQLDAARAYISYEGENGPINGIILGVTVGGEGFWVASVEGVVSDRDPDEYVPMLQAMAASKEMNPAFIEQQRANYEANLAALRAQHANNMARLQASANAHQAKMQAIWAANDASMASYYDRMNSMDNNQRSFLNYINEEHTVATSGGQSFQVSTGYDNYFVNPNTGEYAAGASNFGESDLRELGLNPSDYEQVTVVR